MDIKGKLLSKVCMWVKLFMLALGPEVNNDNQEFVL